MADEMSREEKIAAAKAKAEALKAQRAAAAGAAAPARPAAPGATPQAPGGTAAPGKPPAAPAAAPKPAAAASGKATSQNPGGAPPGPPQNPDVEAFGTMQQSVEIRAGETETQNLVRLLGGLGLYRNPVRGTWQLDYRYYAEARRRLEAAGYRVKGQDYLGRPLEQWAPYRRGWTMLPPGDSA
jgi:hypothetical protein